MSGSAVGALILSTSTGRMMLNLRSTNSTYSNNWGFVGGKIEYGETPIQALKREMIEELGNSVPKLEDIIPFDIFSTKNKKFKYYSFLIIVDNEFIPDLNSESSGYAWVQIGQWPKPLHPGAKSILYNNNLLKDFNTLWSSMKNDRPFFNSLS